QRTPFRRHAAIVEHWLANEFNLDPAFETDDGSHQQMISVRVGRRPGVRSNPVLVKPGTDRQRVANDNPTGWCLPRPDQDFGTWVVDPLRRVVDAEGTEPKAPGLPVE